jgi:hypothetical protein
MPHVARDDAQAVEGCRCGNLRIGDRKVEPARERRGDERSPKTSDPGVEIEYATAETPDKIEGKSTLEFGAF